MVERVRLARPEDGCRESREPTTSARTARTARRWEKREVRALTEKAMWRDPALVVARELEDDHRDPAGLTKHAQRCRGDGHHIRLIGMSGFGSSPVRKSATNEAHSSGFSISSECEVPGTTTSCAGPIPR